MKTHVLSLLVIFMVTASIFGQRDAPVHDSYLDRISIFETGNGSRKIRFDWVKNGGAHEHVEHQVYLLAYLEKDEAKIRALMWDPKLMSKYEPKKVEAKVKKKGKTPVKVDKKRILDVLLEKGLVTVLDNRVVKRRVHTAEEERREGRRGGWFFPYSVELKNEELFKKVSAIPGFDKKAKRVNFLSDKSYKDLFKDEFKLMPFIPVNDSQYANKVAKGKKTDYDFAYLMDLTAIAQYLRPLPYVFRLTRFSEGRVAINIH